jgi:hypothetical protein
VRTHDFLICCAALVFLKPERKLQCELLSLRLIAGRKRDYFIARLRGWFLISNRQCHGTARLSSTSD